VPSGQACPFTEWQSYKGTKLYRGAQSGAYFFSTDRIAIDADGAPNAYHPDDVGKACHLPGKGLDCPANAGYPNTSWWNSVLAPDTHDASRAYVQTSGSWKGYFVSKTALTDPENNSEIDTARYVDASRTPYIVFPGPFYKLDGTGKLGDLGVAYHSVTKNWIPFIVADVGPDDPLGESSIALLKRLGGANPNPRDGTGVAHGKVMYVVFPRSVDKRAKRWPIADQEISDAANALLDQVGGRAVFDACAGLG